MSTVFDRQKGCFFGLAIGDALGAPLEKQKVGTFEPVKGFTGKEAKKKGDRECKAGEWTDDTSMALALADSLSKENFCMYRQLDNYLLWYRMGAYTIHAKCFGMGGTTRRALEDYEKVRHCFADNEDAAFSNGSIMRIAPIAIRFYDSPFLEVFAKLSSQTTHNSWICKSAAIYMSTVLAGLIRGCDKELVLDPEWGPVAILKTGDNPIHPDIIEVANGSYKSGKVIGGFTARHSLEAALWCFWSSKSFEETVLKAVNLGDDADTTGAVSGQFAGAFYGFNNIPPQFVDGLVRRDLINKYFLGIHKVGYTEHATV